MPHWTRAVLQCGLPFLLGGCGGEAPHPTWDDLFVELGTTALSDSALSEINRSIDYTNSRPLSAAVLNSAAPYLWTARQGEELAHSVMGIPAAILDTPYWTGDFRLIGARSGGSVFAAVNLLYPIYVYGADGALIDSLANPPASWRQARRPKRGEFSPDNPERSVAYHRSHTVITGLAALADSVLIVAHGEYRASDGSQGRWKWDGHSGRTAMFQTHGLSEVTTVIDVYFNGRRVISDQPAPGEIFGSGPGSVFFLKRDPAGTGWLLIEFGVRPSRDPASGRR